MTSRAARLSHTAVHVSVRRLFPHHPPAYIPIPLPNSLVSPAVGQVCLHPKAVLLRVPLRDGVAEGGRDVAKGPAAEETQHDPVDCRPVRGQHRVAALERVRQLGEQPCVGAPDRSGGTPPPGSTGSGRRPLYGFSCTDPWSLAPCQKQTPGSQEPGGTAAHTDI